MSIQLLTTNKIIYQSTWVGIYYIFQRDLFIIIFDIMFVTEIKITTIMKKITFDELIDLLYEIDYIDRESYPIVFSVNGKAYQAGIGNYCAVPVEDLLHPDYEYDPRSIDDLKTINEYFEYNNEELLYIGGSEIEYLGDEHYDAEHSYPIFYAIDPDWVTSAELKRKIKKICEAKTIKDAEIYLDEQNSFSGIQLPIFWDEFTDEMVKLMRKTNKELEQEENEE